MANLIRKLYRNALSKELGVVGDEIQQVAERLDALIERYERLRARIGMKELREQRGNKDVVDDDVVAELRAAMMKKNGSGLVAGPSGHNDRWPEQEL